MGRQLKHLIPLLFASVLLACLPFSQLSLGNSATPTANAVPTAVAINSPAPTTAPTLAPTATTVLAAPTRGTPDERTITVTALAVDTANATGNAHEVHISVRPKSTSGMSVGFFSQTSGGGMGPTWQSAAWTSTTAAALMLGVDLSSYQISFDTSIEAIDGPSASGLMTVAVLADILGDDVRQDAAMTGTINPDGTIGPVGGVPQKIQGAAAAGKKMVVVPEANRTDEDLKSKKNVDVVQWGRNLGVDVRLVSTVYEAYQLMTGKELPRPTGNNGDSTLSSREAGQFAAETKAMLDRYNNEIKAFNALPSAIRSGRTSDVKSAANVAQQAVGDLNQGHPEIASQFAFEALSQGASLNAAAQLDELYAQDDYQGMVKSANALLNNLPLDATLEHLKNQAPRTASDAIVLMDAYSDAAAAFSLAVEGSNYLDAASKQIPNSNASQGWLDDVYRANGDFSDASVYLELTNQETSSFLGFGQVAAPTAARTAAISATLEQAANANLTYFENLLDEMAGDQGVDATKLRDAILTNDGDYRDAKFSLSGITYASDHLSPGLSQNLMTLGNSLNAYAYSAVLIAKYYSLQAELDKNFEITGFGDQTGLVDMLDLAEQRSGQLIQLERKEQPLPILFYHNNARQFRQGQPNDQAIALFYFWEAAAESQVLGNFSQAYPQAIRDALKAKGHSVSSLLEWGWRNQ